MRITKKEASRFILNHQKLMPPRGLKGKNGIMEFINLVGAIQFDPLDVAGYNSNLVLQSRIKNYKISMLYELMYEDRKLIDGWDKNMCIFSTEDWPYFKRYREEWFERFSNRDVEIDRILEFIRKDIREKGPLSSKDLEFDTKVDWAWAPTRASRAALESMYFWGELIVHHKLGTRRFYDFTDKYIEKEILEKADPNKNLKEYFKWAIKRRIGAIGLLWNKPSDAWLGIHWMKSNDRKLAFQELIDSGEVLPIEVEDIEHTLYLRKDDIEVFQNTLSSSKVPSKASFIAPLDNLMWDRKLIKEIFDFHYTWEVYKPKEIREYGYYVLPVLYKDKFIARFEPRYNKKIKTLEIINWWWEENITLTKAMENALVECFSEFMEYLGAEYIEVNGIDDLERLVLDTNLVNKKLP